MDGVCSGGYSTAAAGHSGRSEGRGWMDDFAGESSYLQHRMRSVCWPGLVEPASAQIFVLSGQLGAREKPLNAPARDTLATVGLLVSWVAIRSRDIL